MNLIDTGRGVVVFNVFPVRPENQEALVETIRSAGDASVIPGLLSMNLLRSEDGTHVINHMCWESREAFERAAASSPEIAAVRDRVGPLLDGPGPYRYEIVPVGP
jgi:heme-degrading monooxygenase HmoA